MANRPYINGLGLLQYRGVSGDGSELDPDSFWVSLIQGGSVVSSSNRLAVELPSPPSPQDSVEPQLTAVGNSTTARDGAGLGYLSFYILITGLGGTETVTLLPEISSDSTNWYPLGEPYEVSGDELIGDKTAIIFAYKQPLLWVRLNWLAGSFAGTVTIDVRTVIS